MYSEYKMKVLSTIVDKLTDKTQYFRCSADPVEPKVTVARLLEFLKEHRHVICCQQLAKTVTVICQLGEHMACCLTVLTGFPQLHP